MNPYNPIATCPKCERRDAIVFYCDNHQPHGGCLDCEQSGSRTGQIHYTCKRCSYEWLEGCLDV